MDSITHIVLGAAIGEAVLGKKIGKKAMLWGALADTIPDFDVIANPFMDTIDGLFFHRGITHSIFFCLLVPPLLGYLFNRWHKQHNTTLREWTLLFLLGISTHIFIDCLTAYETGIFEPFSRHRVSYHVLFIADPFYTLPLLVSFIALLILKRNSPKRMVWAKNALLISSLYLALVIGNKFYMNSVFEESLRKQNIRYSRILTQPTPLNNFLWSAFAEDSTGYWIGYYSLFDKNKNIEFYHIDKNEHLLADMKSNPDIEKLKTFSHNFYVISVQNGVRYFNVIQFGQFGGWYNKQAPFAFSFGIEKGKGDEFDLQKGRWRSSSKEVFLKLIERIKGK